MPEQNLIDQLNASGAEQRLAALRRLKSLRDAGDLPVSVRGRDVNNHIHTTYSFSPYSPTKAVWMADRAGLVTAGIMDHDSISGAKEFIEAGAVLGLRPRSVPSAGPLLPTRSWPAGGSTIRIRTVWPTLRCMVFPIPGSMP